MDAKTSDWQPGPTVCRCCFTEGCYKDISTEYFWMGKREVYAEMLSETFSVSISYSKSGGPNSHSRLICEQCISRLRDAADFRRQVVECEKMFIQHLDPCTSSVEIPAVVLEPPEKEVVKLERVKLEKEASDEEFDDRGFPDDDDDDDDDMDDEPLMKLATKIPKKETMDLRELLSNSKLVLKRKAPATKTKPTVPAKKLKSKKEVKPAGSKAAAKPAPKPVEKKKKGQDDEATTSTSTGSRAPRGKNAQYYRDYRIRKRAELEKESFNRTSDPADSSTVNVAGSVTSKKRKSAAEYQREYRARKKAKRDNILVDSLAEIPSTSTGGFTTTHQSTIVDQLTTAGSLTSSDIGFAKSTRRKTPAEYQREYRARKKAQRESTIAAKNKYTVHMPEVKREEITIKEDQELLFSTVPLFQVDYDSTLCKPFGTITDFKNLMQNLSNRTDASLSSVKSSSTSRSPSPVTPVFDQLSTVSETVSEKELNKLPDLRRNALTVFEFSTAYPFNYGNNKFKCFVCSQHYLDLALLKQHMVDNHTFESLKRLVNNKRENDLKVDVNGMYCKICGDSPKDLLEMKIHLKKHDKDIDLTIQDNMVPFKLEIFDEIQMRDL